MHGEGACRATWTTSRHFICMVRVHAVLLAHEHPLNSTPTHLLLCEPCESIKQIRGYVDDGTFKDLFHTEVWSFQQNERGLKMDSTF